MRSVQVTSDVTLKSYTFSKPLDLSESNGKKKKHINGNILIRILLIILYLLHSIPIFKSKKKSICLSLFLLHHTFLSLSFSSTALPPSWLGCQQKEKKKPQPLDAQLELMRY